MHQYWSHRFHSISKSLKVTPLYNLHKEMGARFVEFAGYEMPIVYADQGIIASHLFTRSSSSLFDVSHMLQSKIYGKDRIPFLESLCVSDLQSLGLNNSELTLFLNDQGGIIDDAILTKFTDHVGIVSNAGTSTKIKDMLSLYSKRFNVEIEHSDNALIALQGPKSCEILEKLSTKIDFKFMQARPLNISGIECMVSRSGYTGEDGFEISVPPEKAETLCRDLLFDPRVKLAGLAARDTLRLEAGLCLYGQDIDENTTPVEANLSWAIKKKRREFRGFPGFQIIKDQLTNGVSRKRVGMIINGAPARAGSDIILQGQIVGRITSGTFSPCLKKNIAMGLVKSEILKTDRDLQVKIRDELYTAVITKLPFVPTKYVK